MGLSPYMKNLRAQLGPQLVMSPSVAAIIRNEAGQILFLVRADNGLWDLPAGAIDPGETPAQAIVREVREETGLNRRADRGCRRIRRRRLPSQLWQWGHRRVHADRVRMPRARRRARRARR